MGPRYTAVAEPPPAEGLRREPAEPEPVPPGPQPTEKGVMPSLEKVMEKEAPAPPWLFTALPPAAPCRRRVTEQPPGGARY